MKLRVNWAEKYEVVREFPSFVLDSNEFPELELEMLQVYNAGSAPERSQALDALEYKMHQTQPEGGETIFEMLGPYDHDKFEMSEVHMVGDEIGSLVLTEEKE
tara:strand:- start:2009 stop:2317 length:309 start_codon:yes stop_codon:yes gene_type:complete